MFCCEPSGFEKKEINGTCKECGEPTVDGKAYECCGYSPCECEVCGYSPCDGSC